MKWISIISNGIGFLYLIYLLVSNGFPQGGQPLFIVILIAVGQISALAFSFKK